MGLTNPTVGEMRGLLSPALEERIEAAMRAHHVPGLALAVVREHEPAYARGFGVASVETSLPVTPGTLFRIGSITKSLTALAVLRLVEAGLLDLDVPVQRYAPSLRFRDARAAEGPITLRRLLSHSAGLQTDHSPHGPRDAGALERYVRDTLSGYRFVAPPGKLYAYSNPGVRLAGYVAQVISARPYTALMDELVFGPLGMDQTTFDPVVAMTYPLALAHDLEDGRLRVRRRYADDASGYPSGFAISSALDLARLARMLMGAGRLEGQAILSAGSAALMQTAQVDRLTATNGGYGLGLSLDDYKGLVRVHHNGEIDTFGSRLAMIPAGGTAVVLLANRSAGFWGEIEGLVDAVLDEVLALPAAEPEPAAVEPDRAAWPLFAGAYLGDWVGLAVIRATDDELVLDWNGAPIPLRAHSPSVYFGRHPATGERVDLGLVSEGGRPVRYVQINSSPAERYEPDPAPRPDPAALAAAAGRYRGAEGLALRVEGGRLLAYVETEGREMPCVPLSATRLACDAGLIDLQVAPDGSVPEIVFGQVYALHRRAAAERIDASI